jgi:drug/metabolite transporter (DMT)-like permease
MTEMNRPMPHALAIAVVACLAVVFASNHVAARLAFDHGVSVITAVSVRSVVTVVGVLLLLRLAGVSAALPLASRRGALIVGLILSLQSFSLYSAVSRIPVALALLTFNTFPIGLALLSWATTGERPARRTGRAMPVILVGLVLALDIPGVLSSAGRSLADPLRFAAGVGFGLAASVSFATVLLLTTRWLNAIDGRVRTVWTMGVVALVVSAAGIATDGFAWPVDAAGWTGLALLSLLYGSAFTAMYVLVPRMGAVNTAPVLNIEPVASMVIAWAALGQTIAPIQVLGALLVVGSVIWMNLGRR